MVEANGTGSLVSLPALTTITADTTHANSLTQVLALNGGDLELPALAQVSGGPVLFRSNGTGGKLDIAALTTLVGPTGQNSVTTLEADSGGVLLATDLSSISGVDVLVTGGSQQTFAALTSYVGGVGDATTLEASGAGSLVSLPKLTTITTDTTQPNSLTQVQAIIGGDVELPALSQVSGGPVLFAATAPAASSTSRP